MKQNKVTTTLTYIVLNLVLIGFIFTFYFVFASRFETDYRDNYVNQFQVLLEEKLSEKLEIDYHDFLSLTNNNTILELNQDIVSGNLSGQTPYLSFVKIVNNEIVYQGVSENILSNPLQDDHFVFFDEYFGFINNDVVGLFNARTYFKSVLSLTDATNAFIMNNEGEIFFSLNEEITFSALHVYLPDNTDDLIENEFSKLKKDIVVATKIGNDKVLFKFTKLDNYTNLYIAQHFVVANINAYSGNYTAFLLILLILFVAISLFVLLFIFNYLNKITSDIEGKRMLYYYNKPYIIQIDKKYKIKNINKTLLKDLNNPITNLKEVISDFSEETINTKLERGQIISILINEVAYPFIPLKVRNGYYLVAKSEFEGANDPKLERLAYISQQTNLPNYYKLLSDLDIHYNNLVTNKEAVFSIIMLDVKGFKHINKNLKREASDLVLRNAGERVSQILANEELYQIYSQNDIFVVLLPNKDKAYAEKTMKKINGEFLKPIQINKNKMTLTFVGAILEANNQTNLLEPKEIMNHLEETLKKAKELTTSNYYIYDETIAHYVTFRKQTEIDLLEGINKDQFEVYLQPKYNYQTDKIAGFEALVRWNHPQYFNISPLEYITLAEENGLIVELGNIIKTKTFEAAKAMEKYNMRVSLNISPIEIMQPGFIDDFLREYNKYKFRPNTIIVELTETAIIESITVVNDKLKILQKNGILVHLDDFGTGYSTLPYIKDLRFDAIKIDKMYIDYIDTDSYSKAIVNMIISLAKTLNLSVIAEGVEHERQMKELVKLGCYIIQGYLISPAVNLVDAIKLVVDYNIDNTKGFKGGKNK